MHNVLQFYAPKLVVPGGGDGDGICRRIDCEQIRSRINQQLIAGRFGHEGLRQLHTKVYVFAHKQFTYTLKSVAMSLYDIVMV